MRQLAIITLAMGLLCLVTSQEAQAQEERKPTLEEVAASTHQWTGVAVSKAGRLFVNYPRWREGVKVSVAELDASGTPTPFPSKEWNTWTGIENPAKRFVAVQSVYVDQRDRLWVLDSGNPMFSGVIANGAKLVEIDLSTNRIERTFIIPRKVAKSDSYLNDVRIDNARDTAYITDSGNGALIVVYLSSSRYRRVLDDHPSTHAEAGVTVTVQEVAWLRQGKTPQVHSDGIALDRTGGYLYYQALTGKTLYRISTEVLRDPTLDDAALAAKVERVAEVGVSDGLLFGPDQKVYLSSLELSAIRTLDAKGQFAKVFDGPQIAWPDSFALDSSGRIYFTTSRIHEGRSPATVYKVFRITP